MLVLARRRDWPDHDMNARINHTECDGSWWWDCDHIDKVGKTKVKCSRIHRISCDGGAHIPLEVAEVALRQAGWRQADDGGWRCLQHRTKE